MCIKGLGSLLQCLASPSSLRTTALSHINNINNKSIFTQYSKLLWVKTHLHSNPGAASLSISKTSTVALNSISEILNMLTLLLSSLPASLSLFICSFFSLPVQYLYINLSLFSLHKHCASSATGADRYFGDQ